MTEATIRKAIEKKLTGEGWVLWFVHKRAMMIPGRAPIWRLCDIHTIWDTMALRGSEIKLVQYTSASNVSARIKKIEKYYEEHDLSVPCEVWGYKGRNEWRIEKLPRVDK